MAIDQDAYCTLVMNDGYVPGAAILAHSLRDAGTTKKLAAMVTLESVSSAAITELKSLYDYVLPVERVVNPNPSNLYLMDRSDLLYAFTKINLWRLTQFRKIVYIDADVVALRAPDELFDIKSPFAAAPDVGWPDAFNTGVMALTPHMGEYWALQGLAASGDSFDGADQGLLNQYYEHKDWHRLSFAYNCTPSANYQYEPAYRYHKSNISMLHFIGSQKPWTRGRASKGTPGVYKELLSRWWAVYDRHYKDPTTAQANGTPPSYFVQSLVKGEPIHGDYQISTGLPALEAQITTTEPSLTDPGERAEEAVKGNLNPTPTVEQRKFSAPFSEWDATRAPPPSDAKPEAANFPSQQYEFNHDRGLFQAPQAYPEPPRDMWYEVPKEKPLPHPIFPWEERRSSRPTRVFAEDLPQPTLTTKDDEVPTPTTPTIRVISDESIQSMNQVNKNAWDEVAGIDNYVRQMTTAQRLRGKLQVISDNTSKQAQSPETESTPSQGRRESMVITDFPTAIERPSLPVTPAPIRRPNFWGEERDALGQLPQAEGVPDQAEWNPQAKLEELRRNSLIDPSNLKFPAKNVPRRDIIRSSVSEGSGESSEPHVHFGGSQQSVAEEVTPSAPAAQTSLPTRTQAAPTFGSVNFAPVAATERQEDVLSPTEHGSRSFG